MILIRSSDRPSNPADPANFQMPALFQRLVGEEDAAGARLYRVSFEEGARTHWHTHSAPQLLFGLSGRCVVENRQGEAQELGPGDVVVIPADEEHWHGAAPGGTGEHLAINLGEQTVWLGP